MSKRLSEEDVHDPTINQEQPVKKQKYVAEHGKCGCRCDECISMIEGKYTYTYGFKCKFNNPFTCRDFIQMCERVSHLLNVRVVPEPITEGGFELKSNINERHYKSMRFHFCYKKPVCKRMEWPWIRETTYEEWRMSDTVLFNSKCEGSVMLKAFYGSPLWTLDELRIFKEIFESYGVKVTCMPTKKSLEDYGIMGGTSVGTEEFAEYRNNSNAYFK